MVHVRQPEQEGMGQAAVQAALSDLDDDAYRRGASATYEDYDRAVVRHTLTVPEANELLEHAVGQGILERGDVTREPSEGVLSPERVTAIRDSGVVPDALDLFLERASHYPLLDAARERELARAIEAGERVLASDATGPDADAIIGRGRRAKDEFISSNIFLVVSIAKEFRGRGIDFPDLVQYGILGLNRAVEKFDWTMGFKLSTYATWWIRQAIHRALADYGRLIRLPVHQVEKLSKVRRAQDRLRIDLGRQPDINEVADELGLDPAEVAFLLDASRDILSLDAPLGDSPDSLLRGDLRASTAPSLDDLADAAERREAVRAAVSTLPYRERRIIEMRYGLGTEHPQTLEEVGSVFSVTRERVRQIEKAAKEKLKPCLRERGIGDMEEDDDAD